MFKRILFLILLLINIENTYGALIGPSGPDCILANDLQVIKNQHEVVVNAINPPTYDFINKTDYDITLPDGTVQVEPGPTIIPAANPIAPWVPIEGLEFIKGQSVKIFTQGYIDICGNDNGDNIEIAATSNGWIKSNVFVDPSVDQIELLIALLSSNVVDPDSGSTDIIHSGKGLYVYIGNNPPTNLTPDKAGAFGSQFFQLSNPRSAADPSNLSGTVTIYDNSFSGPPPAAGYVWFRYRDATADTVGGWGNGFGNNQGKYKVKIMTPCNFMDGKYLVGYIGPNDPNSPRVDPMTVASDDSLRHIGLDFFDPPGKAWADGNLWFTIMDRKEQYADNSGAYRVHVAIEGQDFEGFFADITKSVINPIKKVLENVYSEMFNNIVKDKLFQNAVRAFATLYIVITFILFMFGVIRVTQFDFVIRVTKVIVVLTLISPILNNGTTPWEFFYNNFFKIYLEGMVYMINVMLSLFNPTTIVNSQEVDFAFLDYIFYYLFHKNTMIKLFSVFLSGMVGIIIAILMVVSFGYIILAFIKAVIIFILANVMISILIVIFPFFLVTILFGATRQQFFDKWLSYMFNYTMQPILVFTVIVLFTIWIFSAMKYAIGFAVCKKCVIGLGIPASISDSFGLPPLTFCLIEYYLPWGEDNSIHAVASMLGGGSGVVKLFFPVAILLIFATTMSAFVTFATHLGTALTGIMSTSLSDSAGRVMTDAANAVGGPVNTVYNMAAAKIGDMKEESKTNKMREKLKDVNDKDIAGGDASGHKRDGVASDPFANHRGKELPKPPGSEDPFANHRDKELPKPPGSEDPFANHRGKELPKSPGSEDTFANHRDKELPKPPGSEDSSKVSENEEKKASRTIIQSLEDKVSHAKDEVKESISKSVDDFKTKAQNTVDDIKDLPTTARKKLEDAGDNLEKKTRDAADKFTKFMSHVQESPDKLQSAATDLSKDVKKKARDAKQSYKDTVHGIKELPDDAKQKLTQASNILEKNTRSAAQSFTSLANKIAGNKGKGKGEDDSTPLLNKDKDKKE